MDGVRVIGERINPTGKKAMKEALKNGDEGYIVKQALEQEEAGADILDVNAGLPEIDEKAFLTSLVRLLQRVTDLPLQLACTKPDAVESALRAYHGTAIVNSVTGDESSRSSILQIAAHSAPASSTTPVDERCVPY